MRFSWTLLHITGMTISCTCFHLSVVLVECIRKWSEEKRKGHHCFYIMDNISLVYDMIRDTPKLFTPRKWLLSLPSVKEPTPHPLHQMLTLTYFPCRAILQTLWRKKLQIYSCPHREFPPDSNITLISEGRCSSSHIVRFTYWTQLCAQVLEFMTCIFNKGLRYSTINIARAPSNFRLLIKTFFFLSHPLLKRFL